MIPSRKKPPLLPGEMLKRVLRLAAFDGRFLLFSSGLFAMLSAANGQIAGAIVGCAAAGAGALELHGMGQIRAGNSRGMDWLVRSQLVLLASILIFLGWSIATFDLELLKVQLRPAMSSPLVQQALEQMQMTEDQYLTMFGRMLQAGKVIAAIASIFYQGGMAVYYHRRRQAVDRALES